MDEYYKVYGGIFHYGVVGSSDDNIILLCL